MLKIPMPGDHPAPLVVPVKGAVAGESETAADAAEHDEAGRKRRKKRRKKRSDENDWDETPAKVNHRRREDRRQMMWMLLGGGTLFALIVAGVAMTLWDDGDGEPVAGSGLPLVAEADGAGEESGTDVFQRSDAEFLKLAEPLAERFLNARRVEDLQETVRNPDLAEPRMRAVYPDGKLTPPGMAGFNLRRDVVRKDGFATVTVRTRDYEDKALTFSDAEDGVKVDWESWAGWSAMPWPEFLDKKPEEARVFRVTLSPVDYYNFGFSDDRKWHSYQLVSPDGEHALYAYAERDSVLDARLKPGPDVKHLPLMLALKFPEGGSHNQVLIEDMTADSWVVETEPEP